jgi:hypothetical protein
LSIAIHASKAIRNGTNSFGRSSAAAGAPLKVKKLIFEFVK